MVMTSFQALEEAYKTIELLFDRIKSISEKAERSEQTVGSCIKDHVLEISVFVHVCLHLRMCVFV